MMDILFFALAVLVIIAAVVSFRKGYVSGFTTGYSEGIEFSSGVAYDVIIGQLIERNIIKKVYRDGKSFLEPNCDIDK